MEMQKDLILANNRNRPEMKNKVRELTLLDFKTYHNAMVIKSVVLVKE